MAIAVLSGGCSSRKPEPLPDLSIYKEPDKFISDVGYESALTRGPDGCVMVTFPSKGTQYIAAFPAGSTITGDTINRPDDPAVTIGQKFTFGGRESERTQPSLAISPNCENIEGNVWLVR